MSTPLRFLALAVGLALVAPRAGAQTFSCAEHGDASCRSAVRDANRGTPGVSGSVITVPAGACRQVESVAVDVTLLHDFVGDLTIRLTAPNGATVTLLDRPATAALPAGSCPSDDVGATFEDGGAAFACPHTIPTASGSVAPAEPLAGLAGSPGAGDWALQIADAVHSGTGALEAWSVRLTCREICDNCIDDDGDAAIDRGDPDCVVAGNGAGLGGDAGRAAASCQKALHKAGATFANRRVKGLNACVNGVLGCVQRKPGDAACLARASGRCAKALDGFGGAAGTLAGAVTQSCPDAAALLDSAGLGFGAEASLCAARGVPALATPSDVAACVVAVHACQADALVAAVHPRAAELLALAGRNPAQDHPCLAGTTSGGAGLEGAGARAAVKCATAASRASAAFVAKKTKALQKCATLVGACVQQNDANCVSRVRRKCNAQVAKLRGLRQRLANAIERCAVDALVPPAGLGFESASQACGDVGFSVGSAEEMGLCVATYAECRVDQLLEAQAPRLRELLGLAGAPLP